MYITFMDIALVVFALVLLIMWLEQLSRRARHLRHIVDKLKGGTAWHGGQT